MFDFGILRNPKSDSLLIRLIGLEEKATFFGFHAIFHSIGDIIVHSESRHLFRVAAERNWKAGLIGKLVG